MSFHSCRPTPFFSSAPDQFTRQTSHDKLTQLNDVLPQILIPSYDIIRGYDNLPKEYQGFVDVALKNANLRTFLKTPKLNLASEYGDVLWERYEMETKRTQPATSVDLGVPSRTLQDIQDVLKVKTLTQPSRPTHLLEEIIEVVEESPSTVSGKNNSVALMIQPNFTEDLHTKTQKQLGLPWVPPEAYLKYEFYKLKGRQLLESETSFDYCTRKKLLAPFEKLLAAHVLGEYLEDIE